MAEGKHLKKEPEVPSRSRRKKPEPLPRSRQNESASPARYEREEPARPPLPAEEETRLPPREEAEYAPPKKKKRRKGRVSFGRRLFVAFSRLLCTLLVTVLAAAVGLLGAIFLVTRGPSATARDLFVRTVRETSAVGFLADIFLSPEEVAQIASKQEEVSEYIETDTSLINIDAPSQEEEPGGDGPAADAWGLVDEDGDGIILQEVKGQGFSGYMMVVLDPSRVIVGAVPEDIGRRGYTVDQFVEKFDAVAGVNGGGFEDPNGQGNGSTPDSMVVYEGKYYASTKGCRNYGFFGLDADGILHVGINTPQASKDAKIQYGCSYGPILVSNGVGAENLSSGVNPRTAVGQRSDGAILLLVIDGRQVVSLGATYADLVEIMLSYGAVNAINLDGGSSSMMYYNGEYVNNCASVIGLRPLPTSVLVLKEGVKRDAEG